MVARINLEESSNRALELIHAANAFNEDPKIKESSSISQEVALKYLGLIQGIAYFQKNKLDTLEPAVLSMLKRRSEKLQAWFQSKDVTIASASVDYNLINPFAIRKIPGFGGLTPLMLLPGMLPKYKGTISLQKTNHLDPEFTSYYEAEKQGFQSSSGLAIAGLEAQNLLLRYSGRSEIATKSAMQDGERLMAEVSKSKDASDPLFFADIICHFPWIEQDGEIEVIPAEKFLYTDAFRPLIRNATSGGIPRAAILTIRGESYAVYINKNPTYGTLDFHFYDPQGSPLLCNGKTEAYYFNCDSIDKLISFISLRCPFAYNVDNPEYNTAILTPICLKDPSTAKKEAFIPSRIVAAEAQACGAPVDVPAVGDTAVSACTINIPFKAPIGGFLSIRGDGIKDVTWETGMSLVEIEPGIWQAQLCVSDPARLKYKLLYNDDIWEDGEDRTSVNLVHEPKFDPAKIEAAVTTFLDVTGLQKVSIQIHFNPDLGVPYICGEGAEKLSWDKGIAMDPMGDDLWSLELYAPDLSAINFKVRTSNGQWETGADRKILDNSKAIEFTPSF